MFLFFFVILGFYKVISEMFRTLIKSCMGNYK